MKTIYKYPLNQEKNSFDIRSLPEYASIVRVGLDPSGVPCIWAEVFTEWVEAIEKYETKHSARKIRDFQIVGTGQPVPAGQYVGSWIDGIFVWHLYETTKRA